MLFYSVLTPLTKQYYKYRMKERAEFCRDLVFAAKKFLPREDETVRGNSTHDRNLWGATASQLII